MEQKHLDESEQNRLIIENVHIARMVASSFRGRNVPFEELISRGHLALVEAARCFRGGNFPGWARERIQFALKELTDRWKSLDFPEVEYASGDSGVIERIYEWDIWGEDGNARAVQENWKTLGITSEEIAEAYDKVKSRRDRFASAFMSLDPLQRKLIGAVYLRQVPIGIESAAREYRISYKRAMISIKNALERMREIIGANESKQISVREHSGRVASKNRPKTERRPAASKSLRKSAGFQAVC